MLSTRYLGWLAFLGFGLFLISCATSHEPQFERVTLTEWLHRHQDAPADSEAEKQATAAIRTIGTNALPLLVANLSVYDLKKQTLGKNGFEILGPTAAPAIPALTRLLYDTNEMISFYAAQSLAPIGAAAVPVLVEALEKHANRSEYMIGTHAALVLWELGTNARPAIPVLLEDLRHKNPRIRQRAADTLGNITIDPELVIPALTNVITHDLHIPTCHTAIGALKQYGPIARDAAVPTLLPLLENAQFKSSASNALMEIAPDVLTNAPTAQ